MYVQPIALQQIAQQVQTTASSVMSKMSFFLEISLSLWMYLPCRYKTTLLCQNECFPCADDSGVLKEKIELEDVSRSGGHLAIMFQGQEHQPCEVVDKVDEISENFFHL